MNDERAEIQAERKALDAELAEAQTKVEAVQAKIRCLHNRCQHRRMEFRATTGRSITYCPDCGYQR